jgi:hypothetical protein
MAIKRIYNFALLAADEALHNKVLDSVAFFKTLGDNASGDGVIGLKCPGVAVSRYAALEEFTSANQAAKLEFHTYADTSRLGV